MPDYARNNRASFALRSYTTMYGEPVGGKHLPDNLVDLSIVGDKIPSYIGNAIHLVGALQPACLAMRDFPLLASERLHVREQNHVFNSM